MKGWRRYANRTIRHTEEGSKPTEDWLGL